MQTLLLVDDEPNIVEGLANLVRTSALRRWRDCTEILFGTSRVVRAAKTTGWMWCSPTSVCRTSTAWNSLRKPSVCGPAHFVLLSGFEDFDYIHRASKSTIYRGYLLKSEGDEVVMEKVDKELRLCAEELREETQQGLQRAFLQRAALESALGGGSWRDYLNQTASFSLALDIARPVFMVLGKSPAHDAMDGMQSMQPISGVLAAQAPGISFEALLPEEGTLVWLLQEKAPTARPGTEKIYSRSV